MRIIVALSVLPSVLYKFSLSFVPTPVNRVFGLITAVETVKVNKSMRVIDSSDNFAFSCRKRIVDCHSKVVDIIKRRRRTDPK